MTGRNTCLLLVVLVLRADGKAGSLVDDRGHFYKPLQRGPRGDRERAFYDAVAATLRAEQAAAAPAAPRCSPIAVRCNGATPAAVEEACSGGAGGEEQDGGSACTSPHAPLPWRHRQLRRLFPSFKDAQLEKQRGPMAIMQVGYTAFF